MTKQTSRMKPPTHKRKKNCNGGTALVRSVGQLLGAWGGWLKLVSLARNLTLNSDTAPKYKHMFGPHKGPLTHF